jgi:transaldolase
MRGPGHTTGTSASSNERLTTVGNSYVDTAKAFSLVGEAQRYYEQQGSKTRVLPASLTSIEEVMRLAGSHHITVSPPLLAELAATPAEGWKSADLVGDVFKTAGDRAAPVSADGVLLSAIVGDESSWRLAFTRSQQGGCEVKIIQAINIFSDKQDDLENLVRKMNVSQK